MLPSKLTQSPRLDRIDQRRVRTACYEYLFRALLLCAALSSEQALCEGQGDASPSAGPSYKQIDKSTIEVQGIAALAEDIMLTLTPVKRDAQRKQSDSPQHYLVPGKQQFTTRFTKLDCEAEYQLLLAGTTRTADNDSRSPSNDHYFADALSRHASALYPITLKCEPPWGAVDFSHAFLAPQFNWHAGSILSVTIPERDEDATIHLFAGDASTDTFWYQRSSRSKRGLTSLFDFSSVTTPIKVQLGKQVGAAIIRGPTYFLNVDRSSTSVAPSEYINSHKQLAAYGGVRGDTFALFLITPGLKLLQVEGQNSEWRQFGSILMMTGLEPGLPYSWFATAETWAGLHLQGSFGAPIGVVPELLGGLRTWSASGWDWHWLAIKAQRGQVTSAHLKENGALAQSDFLQGVNLLQFNALECGRTYDAEITTQFGQAAVSHSFTTKPCMPPMAELLLERSGPTELLFRVNARSAHLVKLEINRGAQSKPSVETLGILKGPGSAAFLAKDLKCGTGYRVAVACLLEHGNATCVQEQTFWTDGCAGTNEVPGGGIGTNQGVGLTEAPDDEGRGSDGAPGKAIGDRISTGGLVTDAGAADGPITGQGEAVGPVTGEGDDSSGLDPDVFNWLFLALAALAAGAYWFLRRAKAGRFGEHHEILRIIEHLNPRLKPFGITVHRLWFNGGHGRLFDASLHQTPIVVKVFYRHDDWDRERGFYRKSGGLPGIAELLEPYDIENILCLPRIEGRSLAELSPLEINASLAKSLLETLVAVRRKIANGDFVHGDISPDNILIDGDGKPWIIDWGSSTTRYSTTLAKPRYAIQNRPYDTVGLALSLADVYLKKQRNAYEEFKAKVEDLQSFGEDTDWITDLARFDTPEEALNFFNGRAGAG